jgi:hypothetical protein
LLATSCNPYLGWLPPEEMALVDEATFEEPPALIWTLLSEELKYIDACMVVEFLKDTRKSPSLNPDAW